MSQVSIPDPRTVAEPIVDGAVPGFAERRRIALHEPYPALRSVIASNLTRRGCIVSFKRSPDEVCALLQEPDMLGGAVVDLDGEQALAAQQIDCLRTANWRHLPLVVLTTWTVRPEQRAEWRRAALTALQKPFDMRELLDCLDL